MKISPAKKSTSYPNGRNSGFFEEGYDIIYRSRTIEYRHKVYDIQIPEIWAAEEGSPHMVIIPEYLLLRRRYPLQVYIFAINEYCNSQNKSQRKAAEGARKHFGLTTFSHTTLGRAFKALCKTISKTEETQTSGECARSAENSSGLLAARCTLFLGFIKKRLRAADRRSFESACQIMARRIWILHQKLLI